ncbi:MAG: hypothetical protein AAB509_00330 [Patescibacteria group bacterium]
MNKFRNYFSSSRSEIAKDILLILIMAGMLAIAATSPYFIVNIVKGVKRLKKYPNKKVYNTFYNLKKQGMIDFYERNNQIYISLTEKGKQKAGWMQIDALKIKKPQKWDGKWRILLFDIAEMKRAYREALRGKLKDLNFQLFQKSAWINPYDCAKEVNLLKSFFGLNNKEIKFIVSENIGDETEFVKYFKLK